MLFVDSIARTLLLPSDSPEKYLLRERACKVMNYAAVISLSAGTLFTAFGIHGERWLDSNWRWGALFAGAGSFLIGQEVNGISCSLVQAATQDQVWTASTITSALFKETYLVGKLFSRIVEAQLNHMLGTVYASPLIWPLSPRVSG